MHVTGNIQNMSADGRFISSITAGEHPSASWRRASLATMSAKPSFVGSSDLIWAARHVTTSWIRPKYATRRNEASLTTVGTGARPEYDGCACIAGTIIKHAKNHSRHSCQR